MSAVARLSAGSRLPGTRRLLVLGAALSLLAGLLTFDAPPSSAMVGYGELVYLQKSGDPRSEAYHVSRSTVRGAGARVLSSRRAFGRPSWSPDGRKVVFSGPNGDGSLGRYALYTMNADGSGVQRITNPRYGDFDPVWSPNGRYIAFTRDVRGSVNQANCCEIWVVGADGRGERRVAGGTNGSFPSWSPDTRSLAFAHASGLRIVSTTGGGARTIVSGSVTEPAWSPDGREIAFVRRLSADRSRIDLVNRDGSRLRAHTDPGVQVESPTWAENSRSLFFVAFRGRGYEGRTASSIWRVDADSSLQLMSDPGRQVYHLSYVPRVGRFGDRPVTGDWNGDGRTTASVVRPQDNELRWLLSNTNAAGGVVADVRYGRVGDVPVSGDWDGDGRTDIGVARVTGGVWEWHLRSGLTGGTYRRVAWGYPSDLPIAGDWDGDGRFTPGIARRTGDGHWEYWLMRDVDAGGAHAPFRYGFASDWPVSGDWEGNGLWNVGVVRATQDDSRWQWWLRDGFDAPTLRTFAYGAPSRGDAPVTGAWSGADASGIGVVRFEGRYLQWHQVDATTAISTQRTFDYGYH